MRTRNPIRPYVVIPSWKTYIPHVLLVALLWALTMTLDYHDQVLAAQELAAKHERDFTDCLKGEWRHTTEDGTEWGCLKVEVLYPHEKSRSKP